MRTLAQPSPEAAADGTSPTVRQPRLTINKVVALYVQRINDIHIRTQVTLAALERTRETALESRSLRHFSVPSGGRKEVARIQRNARQMVDMLEQMIGRDERSQSLLMAVSITEDFLLVMLRTVLRAYPERMNRGLKGGDADTRISLDELLERSREEIIEDRIEARLHRALYASPEDYLQYLRSILEIEIADALIETFVETKATRDIAVHANGRANDIYARKAGTRARAAYGEPLGVDQAYFDRSLANMKALIFEIGQGMKSRYASDGAVKRLVERLQD